MVLFTYEKKGAAVYIPHLDLLRSVIRTIRRAGLKVKYSEGFNPHMLLYFSPPIPVGVASECEQCMVVTDETPAIFMQKYNVVCQDGLKITAAEYTKDNTNPSGKIKSAEFEISFPGADNLRIDDILKEKALTAVFKGKDGMQEKEIRALIYDIKKAGKDKITCILASGNDNLRADRFIKAAADYSGIDISTVSIDITRKKLYTEIPKQ